MTVVGGSDDATEEGSVSVVLVIGATVEGPGTWRYGGVGYLVNSLKVAPMLLEIVVFGANSEEVWAGVKPVWRGVNYEAGISEAHH
jgi:hypothetical protein